MSFVPFPVAPPLALGLQAATPVAGVALVNGTPNIITWTAPNDGQQHRAFVIASQNVTVAETGGAVQISYTNPAGVIQGSVNLLPAAATVGAHHSTDSMIIGAGTTISVIQGTALTAGAAVVWAEIWGS